MGDVVKVIELVGDSPHGWTEAVENCVSKAHETIQNITGVEVYNLTAGVADGKIFEYKANVKIAFLVNPGPGAKQAHRL